MFGLDLSTGSEKWKFVGKDVYNNGYNSPAVGSDGSIYFTVSSTPDLYALTSTGNLKWILDTGANCPATSVPTIAPDGTIYVRNSYKLSAISPEGTLLWTFNDLGSGPPVALASDGTIYIMEYVSAIVPPNLCALSPSGNVLWRSATNLGSGLAVDPNSGVIYVLAGGTVTAFSPSGTVLWTHANLEGGSGPTIGPDGTVYYTTGVRLVALSHKTGERKWGFIASPNASFTTPAVIDKNGIVYVGHADGVLYAVTPEGTVKWLFVTGPEANSAAAINCPPAIGADGTIYFANNKYYLWALSEKGVKADQINIPSQQLVDCGIDGKQSLDFVATYPASVAKNSTFEITIGGNPNKPVLTTSTIKALKWTFVIPAGFTILSVPVDVSVAPQGTLVSGSGTYGQSKPLLSVAGQVVTVAMNVAEFVGSVSSYVPPAFRLYLTVGSVVGGGVASVVSAESTAFAYTTTFPQQCAVSGGAVAWTKTTIM